MNPGEKKFYFIGIGGSGMLWLARLAAEMGYAVAGSDLDPGAAARFLPDSVLLVSQNGRGPTDGWNGWTVIRSSAIPPGNPDLAGARREGLTIWHRFDLLTWLLEESPSPPGIGRRESIAVAGTHGKTSTTTMIGELLDRGGTRPGFYIGGRAHYFDSGCQAPGGNLSVYEADESDGSFLRSGAATRIITNIDHDHLEHYRDYDNLLDAFGEFATDARNLILNGDDPGCRQMLAHQRNKSWKQPPVMIRYGYRVENDLVIRELADGRTEFHWDFKKNGQACQGQLEARLKLAGRHYHSNFAAALLAGLLSGLPTTGPAGMASSLEDYRGVARRLDLLGRRKIKSLVTVYDDYGHHPTEIEAVVRSLKKNGPPVWVLFQPHRFTRTRDLAQEFAAVLPLADRLYLLPVYPAGEAPLPGIDSQLIINYLSSIQKEATKLLSGVPSADCEIILRDLGREDAEIQLVCLGAGDVDRWGREVLREGSDVLD